MLMQIWFPEPELQKTIRLLDLTLLKRSYSTAGWVLKYFRGDANYTLADKVSNPAAPLLNQWRAYREFLALYRVMLLTEICVRREFVITRDDTLELYPQLGMRDVMKQAPWFIGNSTFHNSHKSALLAVNYIYYSQYGWDLPAEINFKWPTKYKGLAQGGFLP